MMNVLIFLVFDFIPAVILYAAFAGIVAKLYKAKKLKKQLQKQLNKNNNK